MSEDVPSLEEERALESLLSEQNKKSFLYEVHGKGASPQVAAERCGIPYEVALAWKKTDPVVATAWILTEARPDVARAYISDRRNLLSPDELAKTQIEVAQRVMHEAGLADLTVKFISTMEVDSKDGRAEFMNFLKSGFLRDITMKLGATQFDVRKTSDKPNKTKSEAELDERRKKLARELRKYERQQEAAQAKDAEFDLKEREDPGPQG